MHERKPKIGVFHRLQVPADREQQVAHVMAEAGGNCADRSEMVTALQRFFA